MKRNFLCGDTNWENNGNPITLTVEVEDQKLTAAQAASVFPYDKNVSYASTSVGNGGTTKRHIEGAFINYFESNDVSGRSRNNSYKFKEGYSASIEGGQVVVSYLGDEVEKRSAFDLIPHGCDYTATRKNGESYPFRVSIVSEL